jgi:hypothetical protein
MSAPPPSARWRAVGGDSFDRAAVARVERRALVSVNPCLATALDQSDASDRGVVGAFRSSWGASQWVTAVG